MEPLGLHWMAVSYVQTIAEQLLMGYVLFRFAKPFMENTKGAGYTGIAYFAVMFVLYLMPLPMGVFMAYSIGAFAAFLAMCQTERRHYAQKAFLAMTFFSLHWFASAMAEILYDKLYNFAEHTEYMARHLNMWFPLYVGVCIVYLALELAFMAVGICCILKAYAYKHAAMEKKELLMLSIPSFMGVVGYEIMWYYRNFYIEETSTSSNMYDGLALLYYAVVIITIVVVIVLYQGIKAGQEEKLQNELLAAQVESIRHHIGQVESLYQNIRSIKHDMTNHILTLERLYAGNRTEEAKDYVKDLKAALAEAAGKVGELEESEEIKSGNPITDVILQEQKQEAEKKNICFCSDFHYPTDSGINAFDLSVILSNALQNARENAGDNGTPYIHIISYRKRNAYMIEISNSFTGKLQWDMESGLPLTSKGKSEGHGYGQAHGYGEVHGYGLSNIRRVARKYSGDIDITLKDGEFRLAIMLMAE